MNNDTSFDIIQESNPVQTVAQPKEDNEMLRATDRITALYCRLSVEGTPKRIRRTARKICRTLSRIKNPFCFNMHETTASPTRRFSSTTATAVWTLLTAQAFRKCLRRLKQAMLAQLLRKIIVR